MQALKKTKTKNYHRKQNNFMTRISLLIFAAMAAVGALAQESSLLKLRIEARMDYQREYVHGDVFPDNTGFRGKFVNFRIDGNITPSFSYSYQQRIVKPQKDASFWDATDWLWLEYKINPHWAVNAGKQIVMVGGYEYDRAPIDTFEASEFWNNIGCYQLGAYLSYTPNEGKDKLIGQFCQSPFRFVYPDMYAYNLIWYGNHGLWGSMWSVNLMEYAKGKYINYISLGNRFSIGKVNIDFDFLQRAAVGGHPFFFKDFSIVGEVAYRPSKHVNIWGKCTYDVNKSGSAADLLVLDGTELTSLGGGVDYFPLKNENIRIHAHAFYTFGVNPNADGTLKGKQAFFNVGATWRIDLLNLKRQDNKTKVDLFKF